jgi:RsiW-degrading membrane proteinase PrsW (M82 family)
MDGLVYGAIAGLGFAAPENLLYVLSRGAGLGVIRAVLSVPGHALWGSIIGYYLARQKFTGARRSGLVGLSVAVMLHAAFDYGLVGMDPLAGFMIAIGVVVIGWIMFFRFTKTAHKASPFRPEAHAIRLSGAPTKYCTNCGALILVEDRFCRSCGAPQV